jgi:hypothetical protein
VLRRHRNRRGGERLGEAQAGTRRGYHHRRAAEHQLVAVAVAFAQPLTH